MESIDIRSDRRGREIAATPAAVFAAIAAPDRLAKWWGPAGFTNSIHLFEFRNGGKFVLTMHGPDGTSYANESRFVRIVKNQLIEIEHFSGHHFYLSLELTPSSTGTDVTWCQTFDTAEHFESIAEFVAAANSQNLDRLAAEVQNGTARPDLKPNSR